MARKCDPWPQHFPAFYPAQVTTQHLATDCVKTFQLVYLESNWTDPGCGDPVVMLVITTCYMLRRPPSATTTTSHLYLPHISGHRDTAHVTRDTSGAVRHNTSDIEHFILLFSTTPTSSKSVFTFGSKLKYWRQLNIWKYRILIFCLVSFGLEDEIWRWLRASSIASA